MKTDEMNAESRWCRICNEQGWSEDSQIVHLEGFLRAKGLFVELAAYAARAAEEEAAKNEQHETFVEFGVNEVMPGGAGHNPFDSNFDTKEAADQAGRDYLIDNPEVPSVVIFQLTIVDGAITEDRTLLSIERSDLCEESVLEQCS